MTGPMTSSEIRKAIARAIVGPDSKAWGAATEPLRTIPSSMSEAGDIALLRKGKPVAARDLRGVYRVLQDARAAGPAEREA